MRRFLVVLGIAAALGGCEPVYETGYRLELPDGVGASARSCVADCAAAQQACLAPARAKFAACQDRAVLEQNLCRSNAQIDYETCLRADAPNGATCIYRICTFRRCNQDGMASCEAAYRGCFAGCGGTVVEEPRCVANCPS